jgi:hypothetical protein
MIGARFTPNIPKARKSFWMHPMDLKDDMGYVESHFDLFADSVRVDAR